MLSTTKPQTLSEMMNHVFNLYFPVVKNTYLFLLMVFVLNVFLFSRVSDIIYNGIGSLLYIAYTLKINSLLKDNFQNSGWAGKKILGFMCSRIFPWIGLGIVLVLLFGLLVLVLSGLSLLLPAAFVHDKNFYTVFLYFSIGVGFLIFLAIFVYFYFVTYTFWLEDNEVFQSISESFKLVKGQYFFVVKSLIWFGIVFIPAFILTVWVAMLGVKPALGVSSLPLTYSFVVSVITTIYYPLVVMLPLFLYHNLKLRRL